MRGVVPLLVLAEAPVHDDLPALAAGGGEMAHTSRGGFVELLS
ncbi:hypothetical protein ACIGEZ_05945 [Streptomyces sp. NPDC085481]